MLQVNQVLQAGSFGGGAQEGLQATRLRWLEGELTELRRAPGSFWNPEVAHYGTWIILEHRGKENSPGLQSDTNFADRFGTHIIR